MDILKLARGAGFVCTHHNTVRCWLATDETQLQRFADLVLEEAAQRLREEAARSYTWASENSDRYHGFRDGLLRGAAMIRALNVDAP